MRSFPETAFPSLWIKQFDLLVGKKLYERCSRRLPGLHIEQQSDIPMARGLGSSSACIVAGLLGANRFWAAPYPCRNW